MLINEFIQLFGIQENEGAAEKGSEEKETSNEKGMEMNETN
ncbi:UNVERIFIED_ORG: hypothetical protein QFZ59_001088 [Bacillus sp. B2I3]|nr:hypothetical protein [Bacillus sp. B2I3]